jgi:hypothetical protein
LLIFCALFILANFSKDRESTKNQQNLNAFALLQPQANSAGLPARYELSLSEEGASEVA